jgi:hypothetical protein
MGDFMGVSRMAASCGDVDGRLADEGDDANSLVITRESG